MRTSLVALLIAALPAAASAGPIQFAGMGANEKVTVAGVRILTAYAGEIGWRSTDTDLAGWDSVFYTYCVDLLQNLQSTQQVTQDVISRLPGGEGSSIAWLYNSFAAAAHGNASLSAGLQLAIWNVLYDNDFSVDYSSRSNGFRGNKGFWLLSPSGGARDAANDFLSQLALAGAISGNAIWLNTNLGQDQVTGGPAAVPEPATLLLLGSGVAALAARRRMRKA